MNETKIRKGDIFMYDFGENVGSIQNGYRPVLVLQADNFNAKSPTVVVAPITASIKKSYLPSHIIIGEECGLDAPSMVLLEQVVSVDKEYFKKYIGYIGNSNTNRKIHNALKQLFGYWDYSGDNAADVRCLCPKCLNDYISNSNFAVRRLDPLTAVRDKCDKCNGTGYDYVIYDKRITTKRKRVKYA